MIPCRSPLDHELDQLPGHGEEFLALELHFIAAHHAREAKEVAVHLDHPGIAGLAVKVVDVLGDDRPEYPHPLQLSEGIMPLVRPCPLQDRDHLRDEVHRRLRDAGPAEYGGEDISPAEFQRIEAVPQSPGVAKGRDAALLRHPGARKSH